MSFSLEVKKEIIEQEKTNNSALLCGMILSSGSLVLSGKGISFTISSENEDFINFAQNLILDDYPSAKMEIRQEGINFKQKLRLQLTIDSIVGRQILTDLGILSFNRDGSFVISRIGGKHLFIEEQSKLDFLKGMFLGSGSVSIPESVNVKNLSQSHKSSGYHLEWNIQSKEQADLICQILAERDIISGIVQRNESFVVYIKEAESISSVLGILGAFKSVLVLENERAGREMRNLVNRQSNCISANIDKSISTAIAQLDAIEKIRHTIGIESLPEPLKEVAYARISNPEASLSEILEVLPSKISKGALSQRFKKIIALSKEV